MEIASMRKYDLDNELYICLICGKTETSLKSINIHIKNHLDNEDTSDSNANQDEIAEPRKFRKRKATSKVRFVMLPGKTWVGEIIQNRDLIFLLLCVGNQSLP